MSSHYWLKLAYTGGNNLGDVLTHKSGGKPYHAMVCHSFEPGGWDETSRIVCKCLNEIDVSEGGEIAVVLMSSGPIGRRQGADAKAILAGMEFSRKKLVVYTR